jgi:hypothetical protein
LDTPRGGANGTGISRSFSSFRLERACDDIGDKMICV